MASSKLDAHDGASSREKDTSVTSLSAQVQDEATSDIARRVHNDNSTNEKEEAAQLWAQDPANPRNWSPLKKWTTTAMVALYTFVSPLGSSMMAPALPQIASHYGIDNPTILAMTLSIFLLTFAFGPLILAPMSEMYGRTWVFHLSNLTYLAFNLGCAFAPTTGSFIGFRLLAGFVGSAAIACGGGSVADLFAERDRASAMALYSLGPLLAPSLGPIAGGFIAQGIGFKYIFVVIAGLCALASAIAIPFLEETYAPVLLFRRDRKVMDLETAAKQHPAFSYGSTTRFFWVNLTRPVILITRSVICFMLSLYLSFQYGIYYIMFTTFPELFGGIYGFNTGVGGLAYIPIGLGFISATFFGAKAGDMIYQSLTAKNNGKGTPEMRIPALIFGSFFVPVGVFWYGWSAQAKLHWIMPMIGTAIFGFGLMATALPIQLYLVDTFTYAASAVAAASVFRSLLGFAFPLFGQEMYNRLGLGGGNSLLAGLAIVIGIPFPIYLWFYGDKLRARSSLARK